MESVTEGDGGRGTKARGHEGTKGQACGKAGACPASASAVHGPSAADTNATPQGGHGHSGERSSDTMSLTSLVRLGMDELVALARAGRLRPGHVGVAVKGGRRYHAAIERGDIASEDERARRAAICGRCEHRRWRDVGLEEGTDAKMIASYCGDAFVDQGKGRPCGCLVMVTVAGERVSDHAAGRAMVASERCPLRKARW